jgi:hypothetical protein
MHCRAVEARVRIATNSMVPELDRRQRAITTIFQFAHSSKGRAPKASSGDAAKLVTEV